MKGMDMKKISSVFSLLFVALFLFVSCGKIPYEWVKYWDDKDGQTHLFQV
jgi:hypothetical protein